MDGPWLVGGPGSSTVASAAVATVQAPEVQSSRSAGNPIMVAPVVQRLHRPALHVVRSSMYGV